MRSGLEKWCLHKRPCWQAYRQYFGNRDASPRPPNFNCGRSFPELQVYRGLSSVRCCSCFCSAFPIFWFSAGELQCRVAIAAKLTVVAEPRLRGVSSRRQHESQDQLRRANRLLCKPPSPLSATVVVLQRRSLQQPRSRRISANRPSECNQHQTFDAGRLARGQSQSLVEVYRVQHCFPHPQTLQFLHAADVVRGRPQFILGHFIAPEKTAEEPSLDSKLPLIASDHYEDAV